MLIYEAQKLAANILAELEAFSENPQQVGWPDALWPDTVLSESTPATARKSAQAPN